MNTNTASIIIEEGRVTIRPQAGGVWLTAHEIADIFGVYIPGYRHEYPFHTEKRDITGRRGLPP